MEDGRWKIGDGVTREARVLLNQCEPESGAGEGLVGFSA
jgi:hypothetical protein